MVASQQKKDSGQSANVTAGQGLGEHGIQWVHSAGGGTFKLDPCGTTVLRLGTALGVTPIQQAPLWSGT